MHPHLLDVFSRLDRSRAALGAAVESIAPPLRQQRPDADRWSAAEVLEHLFAADAILAPRLLQILVRPGVALPAFDERVWATLVARAGLTLAQRLDLFAAQRAALVGLARTLTPAEWALEGEHEVAGRRSVHQIASHLVGHEQEHVEQLRALVEPAP